MGIADHTCSIGELDYGNVKDGFIHCDVCGRIYRLTDKGWAANPPFKSLAKPKYWQKKKRRA